MDNLDWYRTFAAVYRAGTMTAAAKQLFLTQPAVTQQIAGLEAALGEPLFIRAARRLAPTERAKSLYVQIAPALERLDGATQTQALGEKTEVLTLLLGAPLEYFTEVALGKLQSLAAQLNVRFDRTQQLLEALAQRELDAVIATQRLPTRDVDFIKIADERFVLVGSAKLKPPAYAIPKTTHKRTLAQIEAWLLQQHWVSWPAAKPSAAGERCKCCRVR